MSNSCVNCGISNLSIYNQKTSIQLLLPSKLGWMEEYWDRSDRKTQTTIKTSGRGVIITSGKVCGHGGCMEYYYPFAFPIHGVYDSSSKFKLKEVVRDKNVELLEEYFNTSIENILQYIDHPYHFNDEYKNMLEAMPEEARKIYLRLDKAYYRTEVLEHLEYGNWCEHLNKPEEEIDYISLPIVREVHKYLELTDRERGEPLLDANEIIEYRRLKKEANELDEDAPEGLKHSIYASIGSLTFGGHDMYFPTSLNMYRFLPITRNDFEDDIIKQVAFVINLGQIGIQLKPSIGGFDTNNHDILFDLNNTIQDLLIIDRKNYYDDNSEVPYTTEGNLLNTVSLDLLDSDKF